MICLIERMDVEGASEAESACISCPKERGVEDTWMLSQIAQDHGSPNATLFDREKP